MIFQREWTLDKIWGFLYNASDLSSRLFFPSSCLESLGCSRWVCDWDSAHHHKQKSDSHRHCNAPRAGPAGGGDQGRILTWGITPWGAAALCCAQPKAVTTSALGHGGFSSCASWCVPCPWTDLPFSSLAKLLPWYNVKLGMVSQLGVNSCGFGYEPQHSPGQGRDLAELSSPFLHSDHWGVVVEGLVCFGLRWGNSSKQAAEHRSEVTRQMKKSWINSVGQSGSPVLAWEWSQ